MDNLGIPESGDGIPDVLQEAKWEADFLAKMQDADGGFYFLVYPKGREYESNVLPENGDPRSSGRRAPPSPRPPWRPSPRRARRRP
jgi:hypothetical protein